MKDSHENPVAKAAEAAKSAKANPFAISRFIVFIAVSIVVAIALVVVSMDIYQKSGAAQLDLSRPSYEDVRSKAKPVHIEGFDSTGPIDKKNLDKFQNLYDKTYDDIASQKDSYSSGAISDKTLGIKVK